MWYDFDVGQCLVASSGHLSLVGWLIGSLIDVPFLPP